MNHKTMKRVRSAICLLLAVLMVLGSLPLSVLAEAAGPSNGTGGATPAGGGQIEQRTEVKKQPNFLTIDYTDRDSFEFAYDTEGITLNYSLIIPANTDFSDVIAGDYVDLGVMPDRLKTHIDGLDLETSPINVVVGGSAIATISFEYQSDGLHMIATFTGNAAGLGVVSDATKTLAFDIELPVDLSNVTEDIFLDFGSGENSITETIVKTEVDEPEEQPKAVAYAALTAEHPTILIHQDGKEDQTWKPGNTDPITLEPGDDNYLAITYAWNVPEVNEGNLGSIKPGDYSVIDIFPKNLPIGEDGYTGILGQVEDLRIAGGTKIGEIRYEENASGEIEVRFYYAESVANPGRLAIEGVVNPNGKFTTTVFLSFEEMTVPGGEAFFGDGTFSFEFKKPDEVTDISKKALDTSSGSEIWWQIDVNTTEASNVSNTISDSVVMEDQKYASHSFVGMTAADIVVYPLTVTYGEGGKITQGEALTSGYTFSVDDGGKLTVTIGDGPALDGAYRIEVKSTFDPFALGEDGKGRDGKYTFANTVSTTTIGENPQNITLNEPATYVTGTPINSTKADAKYSGINDGDYLEWVINVTIPENVGEGIEFSDVIKAVSQADQDKYHKFDQNDTAYVLSKSGVAGNLWKNDEYMSSNPTITDDSLSFKFLKGGEYTLTVRTKPTADRYERPKDIVVNNTMSYTVGENIYGDDATGTIPKYVASKPTINKTVRPVTESATNFASTTSTKEDILEWKIVVNPNEYQQYSETGLANIKISDLLANKGEMGSIDKLIYVSNSLTVVGGEDGKTPLTYTLTGGAVTADPFNGFDLNLSAPLTKPVTITFKTKVPYWGAEKKDDQGNLLGYMGGKFENTATLTFDNQGANVFKSTATATILPREHSLEKKSGTIDKVNKTVGWTIDADVSDYLKDWDVSKLTITDTFENKVGSNVKYVPLVGTTDEALKTELSLVVKVGETTIGADKYTVAKADDGMGFTITFRDSLDPAFANGKAQISYTTKFDYVNVENTGEIKKGDLKNKAEISFVLKPKAGGPGYGNGPGEEKTITSTEENEVEVGGKNATPGKSGSLTADKTKINWTLTLNTSGYKGEDSFKGLTITDKLTDSDRTEALTKESITSIKIGSTEIKSLLGGEDIKIAQDGKGFTITIPDTLNLGTSASPEYIKDRVKKGETITVKYTSTVIWGNPDDTDGSIAGIASKVKNHVDFDYTIKDKSIKLGKDCEVSVPNKTLTIAKGDGVVTPNTKTIKWTTTIDPTSYDLTTGKEITINSISDRLAGKNTTSAVANKPIENVTALGLSLTDGKTIIQGTNYTVSIDDDGMGFKISFVPGYQPKDKITLTYTTSYEYAEFKAETGNKVAGGEVNNTASINYKVKGNGPYDKDSTIAKATVESKTVESSKGVAYDNNGTFTWTIDYNKKSVELGRAIEIVDTFAGNAMNFVPGSMSIYYNNGTDPIPKEDYEFAYQTNEDSIGDPTKGYTLKIDQKYSNAPLKIVYKTQAAERLENGAYKNTVEITVTDETGKSIVNKNNASKTISGQKPSTSLIEKNGEKINSDGRISWSILLNKDAKKITNTVITDILTKGLVIDAATFSIKKVTEFGVDGKPANTETIDPAAYKLDFKNEADVESFEIRFKEGQIVDYPILITYNTTLNNKIIGLGNIEVTNNAKISGLEVIGETTKEVKTKVTTSSETNGDPIKVTLLKIDGESLEGSPIGLEGVVFDLKSDWIVTADGEKIQKLILEDVKTGKGGKADLGNLFPGKYYLEEKETIGGYKLPEGQIEINVGFGDAEVEITVPNDKLYEVTLDKVDSKTGQSIGNDNPGTFKLERKGSDDQYAEYKVEGNDPFKLGTWTGMLPYGDYRLTETESPKGYLKPDANDKDLMDEKFIIEFSVSKDGVKQTKPVVEEKVGDSILREVNGTKFTLEINNDELFTELRIDKTVANAGLNPTQGDTLVVPDENQFKEDQTLTTKQHALFKVVLTNAGNEPAPIVDKSYSELKDFEITFKDMFDGNIADFDIYDANGNKLENVYGQLVPAKKGDADGSLTLYFLSKTLARRDDDYVNVASIAGKGVTPDDKEKPEDGDSDDAKVKVIEPIIQVYKGVTKYNAAYTDGSDLDTTQFVDTDFNKQTTITEKDRAVFQVIIENSGTEDAKLYFSDEKFKEAPDKEFSILFGDEFDAGNKDLIFFTSDGKKLDMNSSMDLPKNGENGNGKVVLYFLDKGDLEARNDVYKNIARISGDRGIDPNGDNDDADVKVIKPAVSIAKSVANYGETTYGDNEYNANVALENIPADSEFDPTLVKIRTTERAVFKVDVTNRGDAKATLTFGDKTTKTIPENEYPIAFSDEFLADNDLYLFGENGQKPDLSNGIVVEPGDTVTFYFLSKTELAASDAPYTNTATIKGDGVKPVDEEKPEGEDKDTADVIVTEPKLAVAKEVANYKTDLPINGKIDTNKSFDPDQQELTNKERALFKVTITNSGSGEAFLNWGDQGKYSYLTDSFAGGQMGVYDSNGDYLFHTSDDVIDWQGTIPASNDGQNGELVLYFMADTPNPEGEYLNTVTIGGEGVTPNDPEYPNTDDAKVIVHEPHLLLEKTGASYGTTPYTRGNLNMREINQIGFGDGPVQISNLEYPIFKVTVRNTGLAEGKFDLHDIFDQNEMYVFDENGTYIELTDEQTETEITVAKHEDSEDGLVTFYYISRNMLDPGTYTNVATITGEDVEPNGEQKDDVEVIVTAPRFSLTKVVGNYGSTANNGQSLGDISNISFAKTVELSTWEYPIFKVEVKNDGDRRGNVRLTDIFEGNRPMNIYDANGYRVTGNIDVPLDPNTKTEFYYIGTQRLPVTAPGQSYLNTATIRGLGVGEDPRDPNGTAQDTATVTVVDGPLFTINKEVADYGATAYAGGNLTTTAYPWNGDTVAIDSGNYPIFRVQVANNGQRAGTVTLTDSFDGGAMQLFNAIGQPMSGNVPVSLQPGETATYYYVGTDLLAATALGTAYINTATITGPGADPDNPLNPNGSSSDDANVTVTAPPTPPPVTPPVIPPVTPGPGTPTVVDVPVFIGTIVAGAVDALLAPIFGPIATFADPGVPAGDAALTIPPGQVPLGSFRSIDNWSLLSLIMSFIAIITGIITTLTVIRRKRDQEEVEEYVIGEDGQLRLATEDDADDIVRYDEDGNLIEEEDKRRKLRSRTLKVLTGVTGMLPMLFWLILDDLTQPMVWINRWTPFVALNFIVAMSVFAVQVLYRRKEEVGEEEENEDLATDNEIV